MRIASVVNLLMVVCIGCGPQPATQSTTEVYNRESAKADKAGELLSKYTNADVRWHPSLVLAAEIPNDLGEEIYPPSENSTWAIVPYLKDPKRYVIAHVALTVSLVHPAGYENGRWNGLSVDFDGDGGFECPAYSEDDMQVLHDYWTEYVRSMTQEDFEEIAEGA